MKYVTTRIDNDSSAKLARLVVYDSQQDWWCRQPAASHRPRLTLTYVI